VLLLLAFLLPLAVYLLVLGFLNRRPHPLLVSGVWDFIGLLFAASGFLLVGGPGILSSLNERWRMYWLLGQQPGPGGGGGGWQFWVFLSALYFGLVVAGSAFLLWRRRHLTAVYNVDPAVAEDVLAEVCQGLGVRPVRSGNLFLFGIVVGRAPPARFGVREGIQAPHYLPVGGEALPAPAPAAPAPGSDLLGQAAILEVDAFGLMNHVTLRWDPPDPPLRHEVEAALARRLAETPAPDSELGGWLLVLGFCLLCVTILAGIGLVIARLVAR
jgi:hypothetical protein